MRKSTIAALLVAQTLAATQPLAAADLAARDDQRIGAFGGVRLRLALGGDANQPRARAGLMLAPTVRSRTVDGAERIRFGEGFEFGIQPNRTPQLSFAGTRVDRPGLVAAGSAPDGPRANLSNVAWAAISVGAVVFAVVLGRAVLEDDEED